MTDARMMEAHRTWQDWAALGIGALIALSPWLMGETSNRAIVMNAVIVGIIIALFGALELVRLHRLEEIGLFACGLWLFVSPFSHGYAGNLAFAHMALGALLTFLAALELWQDWGRTDREMARHGS